MVGPMRWFTDSGAIVIDCFTAVGDVSLVVAVFFCAVSLVIVVSLFSLDDLSKHRWLEADGRGIHLLQVLDLHMQGPLPLLDL